MNETILSLRNVESFYGPIQALKGVGLSIIEGKITTILGANGAGKSTILKTISGILWPRKGKIEYKGKSIGGKTPDKISRMGIAHVPEGREVFPLLSVKDNLNLGAYNSRSKIQRIQTLDEVLTYFPDLKKLLNIHAGLLSGGQQQQVALGRAIMQNPDIVLLDEPSLGLSPQLTQEIFSVLKTMQSSRKLTLILVEQNAKMALELADHGYVLENGRIVLEGPSDVLSSDKDIKEFYLGGRDHGVRGRKRWKKRKSWN